MGIFPATVTRSAGRPNTKSDLEHVNPELLARMRAAYQAAPSRAREGFAVISGYRTREQQAAAYRRYLTGRGGLAAPPGHSRHERGEALDIRDPTGWFHAHGREYGLHWPVRGDYPHTQMTPGFQRRSDAAPLQILSDVTPDPIRPGQQYAANETAAAPPPSEAAAAPPPSDFKERLYTHGGPATEEVEDRRGEPQPRNSWAYPPPFLDLDLKPKFHRSFEQRRGRLSDEAGYFDIDRGLRKPGD
jgi:D-alanyl-D-alanine carboxypeptidase